MQKKENHVRQNILFLSSFICAVFLMSWIYTSCATVRGYSGNAPIHGMVFFEDGTTAAGLVVYVDKKPVSVTNLQGLFTIEKIRAGNHTFSIENTSDEFQSVSRTVKIDDKRQLLVFTVPKVGM